MEIKMDLKERLASSLDRKDEQPNIDLAEEIVITNDQEAISKLITFLNEKDKAIQSDSIKVLYEIGDRMPSLIIPFTNDFVRLLKHSNNRLQWGAMMSLSKICVHFPELVYPHLLSVIEATEKGSVITRDYAVVILIELSSQAAYYQNAFPLLLEQLHTCPTNQLPMYAESLLGIISKENADDITKLLSDRLEEIEKDSKKRRVEKVIQKINKINFYKNNQSSR